MTGWATARLWRASLRARVRRAAPRCAAPARCRAACSQRCRRLRALSHAPCCSHRPDRLLLPGPAAPPPRADASCPGLAPEVSLYTFRVFTNDQVSYTSW